MICLIWWIHILRHLSSTLTSRNGDVITELAKQEVKPRIYSYNELRIATRDFHPDNKLGEGGFGVVYKVRKTKWGFWGIPCGELLDPRMVCCLPNVLCVLSCGMIILSRVCLIFLQLWCLLFNTSWMVFVGNTRRQHTCSCEAIKSVKVGALRFFEWSCDHLGCEASQLDQTKGLLFKWWSTNLGIRICGEQESCTSTMGYSSLFVSIATYKLWKTKCVFK